MSSGLYGVLSGAASRMQLMDTISDNLSNSKTVGFKRGETLFESMLSDKEAGMAGQAIQFTDIREGFSDFSQGTLTRTGVPLNLAINGEGFFKVQNEQGQQYYTRQGNMRLDTEGFLLTGSGLKVIGQDGRPLTLPRADLKIDEDGTVQLDNGEMKKIPIFVFSDSSRMGRVAGGLFAAPQGEEPVVVDEPRVFQGQLEESNVNMMQEMGRMMEAVRSFEACQKAMDTYDKWAEKAISLGAL